MAIDEKTRLDLREQFERLIGRELADAAMEAMPNLDYDKLATKTDVENLGIELRGEIALLDGRIDKLDGRISQFDGSLAQLEGNLRGEMASNLKTLVLTQLATSLALAGFVAGLA